MNIYINEQTNEVSNVSKIWKPVTGYEGLYEVSSDGIIKGLDRDKVHCTGKIVKTHSRILKARNSHKGYLTVALSKRINKRPVIKDKSIHRIVAEAFIPNPENKPQVNHINGIKTDNRIENLEWVTCQENINHATHTGLYPRNTTTQNQINKIIQMRKQGINITEISNKLNVSYDVVYWYINK